MLQIWNPLGGLIYGLVAGQLYQIQADTEGGPSNLVCLGKECYQWSFLMSTCGCVVSLLAAFYLHRRMPKPEPTARHLLRPKDPSHYPLSGFTFLAPFHLHLKPPRMHVHMPHIKIPTPHIPPIHPPHFRVGTPKHPAENTHGEASAHAHAPTESSVSHQSSTGEKPTES